MITLERVRKSYAEQTSLSDVDLEIGQGEFAAILGPSGSGKSTLLNIAAGLLTPTAGRVLHDGISLYELEPRERVAFRRRNFGFIFQSFHLVPYLTALENVEVALYVAGERPDAQRRRALELLERVGLAGKGNRLPTELSVGEQQRVAIARAVAAGPKVMFADEPTGNLDSRAGAEIMELLKELHMQGVTILLVTHDHAMARWADRRIQIVDGRIENEC
jgi:putative ABC transport system ATP-binding protein